MSGDSVRLFSFSMSSISIWPCPKGVQIMLHYNLHSTLKFYHSYENSCACFQKWLIMQGRIIFRDSTPEIVIFGKSSYLKGDSVTLSYKDTSWECWVIQMIKKRNWWIKSVSEEIILDVRLFGFEILITSYRSWHFKYLCASA